MYKKINCTLFLLFCYLFICKSVFPMNVLFDNFEKNNFNKWEFVSDQVMGGISFGKHAFLNENNKTFIRMTGYVSLENNGGFIQVRRMLSEEDKKFENGIQLELRGNNQSYFVHLRTKFTLLPWQYYQGKINTKEGWSKIRMQLKDFSRSGRLLPNNINPKHITSIALVAFGVEHNVRLDVSEIIFF